MASDRKTDTQPEPRRVRLEREFAAREAKALGMGGPERLQRREAAGVMNARSRVDGLLDPGSFIETGLFGVSASRPEDRDRSAADGKVAGFGRIDGRDVAVVSNDFTVMGASSSSTNGRKIGHAKRVATARGLPLIFIGGIVGCADARSYGLTRDGLAARQRSDAIRAPARNTVGLGDAWALIRFVELVCGAFRFLCHPKRRGTRGVEFAARVSGDWRDGRS